MIINLSPRFPRDQNSCKLWKEILQINRKVLPPNSTVCSIHFPVDAIDRTGNNIRLKPNVLPIRFVLSQVCICDMTLLLNIYIIMIHSNQFSSSFDFIPTEFRNNRTRSNKSYCFSGFDDRSCE